MTWIIDNWIIILLGVGFIAFHLFGHGGHGGGHGGGHKHGSDKKPVPPPDAPSVPDPETGAEEDPDKRPPESDGHKH